MDLLYGIIVILCCLFGFLAIYENNKRKNEIVNSKRYKAEREIEQLTKDVNEKEVKLQRLQEELRALSTANTNLSKQIKKSREENQKANLLCDLFDLLNVADSSSIRHLVNR